MSKAVGLHSGVRHIEFGIIIGKAVKVFKGIKGFMSGESKHDKGLKNLKDEKNYLAEKIEQDRQYYKEMLIEYNKEKARLRQGEIDEGQIWEYAETINYADNELAEMILDLGIKSRTIDKLEKLKNKGSH